MPLITPPFRTALLTANSGPLATDNGDIQTTRDWWMYWNSLGDQVNSSSKLATAGTHANRPMPDGMPEGALYYENDRGVLYANTRGVWQYVAGTMYGTLSPDQRPADLGTHDAGFAFRTIVTPAREFIWAQAAWIEVTDLRYGTHAQRLATAVATVWSGMAWMETDRDNVIYQVQNVAGSPAWVYIAGTMADSFSNLPADLGPNDVNFTFATSDTYEVYRWAGSTWVNQTPANTLQLVYPSGSITLTGTATDLPGATITLPRPGLYAIHGVGAFFVNGAGDIGQSMYAQLVADGAAQPIPATLMVASQPTAATITQQWSYRAPTTGKIVKLQGYKGGGTGGSTLTIYSSLSAVWIAP